MRGATGTSFNQRRDKPVLTRRMNELFLKDQKEYERRRREAYGQAEVEKLLEDLLDAAKDEGIVTVKADATKTNSGIFALILRTIRSVFAWMSPR